MEVFQARRAEFANQREMYRACGEFMEAIYSKCMHPRHREITAAAIERLDHQPSK